VFEKTYATKHKKKHKSRFFNFEEKNVKYVFSNTAFIVRSLSKS